ncbi:bestrophin family protein [Thalassorhabdomicrobium marinisediminis]|uniref:bestrophin family protein n=1 Tax=Thalassorhabdomicrobium marinisediminis TaxID=2170577 RepID=UPI00248F89AB|nr:bestrophin family ion channel [Thalassorhabdomicrobium marinisediminis]
MIVREHPSNLKLFFVLQGSIVPKIIGRIVGVALITAIVLLLDRKVTPLPHISIGAMGVFGVALSLFLGFRNNAAYDRWWEARKLWGTMIAEVRTLGRHATIFVDSAEGRERMLSCAVVFAHALRGKLRSVDVQAEMTPWMDAGRAARIAEHGNPADAALRALADEVATLGRAGAVDGFGQMTIAGSVSTLAEAQAGCERILLTPLPFVYSLLVRRTTYLYCGLLPFALIEPSGGFAPALAAVVAYVFFGLQAVTNELELPFRNVENGLPLDAMCRTIEISVAEALGRTPPAPLEPEGHVLT